MIQRSKRSIVDHRWKIVYDGNQFFHDRLMSITLKPEQEKIVQTQIQLGKFATTDQAIDQALRLLEEWDESEARWVEETRQKLASARRVDR